MVDLKPINFDLNKTYKNTAIADTNNTEKRINVAADVSCSTSNLKEKPFAKKLTTKYDKA